MPSLKQVKNRIKSVKSTQQITKAMKMVAASKLRRAQDSIIQMRPYSQKLSAILENVVSNLDESFSSIYAEDRSPKKVLVVVLTSDRGLCGSFNSNALKEAVKHINENYSDQKSKQNLWILPLGKKGFEYFNKRKYQVVQDFVGMFHHPDFDHSKEASAYAMNGFKAGKFDRVDIIYNEFKNVATQILRTEQFLPIAKVNNEETEGFAKADYILEPSVEYIIEELIPQSLNIQFFKAILESNASEHGARMTAMDKATDNAGELLKDLTLMYNRTRQAAITKEILEIVGGAEALASGN